MSGNYLAKVMNINLGTNGRGIKVTNSVMPTNLWPIVYPIDGWIKQRCPAVGETVLVIEAEGFYRYYLPVNTEFSALSSDNTKVQIESAAEVEITGSEIILKVGATDFIALSSLVDARLQAHVDAFNQHTHPTGVGPSGVPTSPMPTDATVAAEYVKAK